MRIRWRDMLLATGIAVWLGVFTVSCVPFWETKPDAAEKSSEKKDREEPPLGTMERMAPQAEKRELASPAQELAPVPGAHPHP